MYMKKFIRETTLSLLHYLIYIHWSNTKIFLDLFLWPRKNLCGDLISRLSPEKLFRGSLISQIVYFNQQNAKFIPLK